MIMLDKIDKVIKDVEDKDLVNKVDKMTSDIAEMKRLISEWKPVLEKFKEDM